MTVTLEKAGNKTVVYEGKPISGKRLLARLLWQGVLSGSILFPDATILHLGSDDWKDLVKFIYSHIDGPPPQQLQHTGLDDGPVKINVTIEGINK